MRRNATEVDEATWREALNLAYAAIGPRKLPLSGSGQAAERLDRVCMATEDFERG